MGHFPTLINLNIMIFPTHIQMFIIYAPIIAEKLIFNWELWIV